MLDNSYKCVTYESTSQKYKQRKFFQQLSCVTGQLGVKYSVEDHFPFSMNKYRDLPPICNRSKKEEVKVASLKQIFIISPSTGAPSQTNDTVGLI